MPYDPRRRWMPTDTPSVQPMHRGARIRRQRTDTLYQIDSGESAENLLPTTLAPGQNVTVQWNQPDRKWQIVSAEELAAHCEIRLLRVWQFDPGTNNWRIRAHPTHRQYVAVVAGGTIKILDWVAEDITDTEAVGSNVGDIAWSPDGLWLAASCATSPHIKVYPFDPVTGLLGSAVTAPATAAPSFTQSTSCVRWHPSGMAIFSTTNTAADPVTGWIFTGGAFGANLAAIPNLNGWGQLGNEEHWLQTLGIWTPPAISISGIDGMDVSPIDGTLVVAWNDADSVHFFSSLPNAIDEAFDPTDFGWEMRHDSEIQSSGPSTYSGKHPVISTDGTLVAVHPNNDSSQGSGNERLGEGLVMAFGQRRFGHAQSFPRHGKLRYKWTDGPYGNRDLLAWRPGRATQQLMVPVAPQTFADPPNSEPRLLLWRFEGDRFAAHCAYFTDIPDDFSWGGLSADASGCWTHDGTTFIAIPEQYDAFGEDCLLVFDVSGDP